jgi:molecular chaperone DnaK
MRTHIDYGIYFNNDFCQIARMENGMPVIKRSNLIKDSMPLCVHFNKRGDNLIGDTAFNVIKNVKTRALKLFEKGKTNTFSQFTRTLGTNHKYESPNTGRSYSSEELLAECFKKLKSLVQDEDARAVAITVPTKFLNPQNEAVRNAGKLAGFEQIELIQEPLAALTGYGLSSNSNGFYLLFDFQSEFNVSLGKIDDGVISIVDTEGDNWLGDKNVIEAIVDKTIITYLKESYEIDFILNDSDKKEVLRNAVKFYAEKAKEQLNIKESHFILSDLGDLPFEDENGDEPEIDIELTQQDLARVSRPIYQKAIDITIDLLKRNNLKGKDIERICLVGEGTYSPILRRMLKEQITDKVDTSVDPMTVVAKGAALFASTISVSDEVKETTRDKTKLQLDIKYEATTVELDEMVNLKVLKEKTTCTFPEKIYADVVRFDGAWSSGKKLIGEKSTIVDVLLVEGRSNSFEINVYDEAGNKLECQPHQFSILQGIGGRDKMQVLPYNIGIAKYFESEGKELFQLIKGLEKNRALPATGVINGFKTKFDLRPGVLSDVIRFPIYQGDYNAEGTNPVLNNLVAEVIITGEDMPALLPEGSDVDITIKVDRSQLMKFSAYFPLLKHTEELEIEIKQTEPPTEEYLTNEISKAKRTAQKINASDVSEKLEALEEQLENEKGSADGKMKILDGLLKELLKLDSAEKVAEWPKIEKELKDSFYEIEKIAINERKLDEIRSSIEIILKEKNLREARNILKEVKELLKNRTIDHTYIDNLKGELVLFYSDNPLMGKERFRFLLGELIRVEKNGISNNEKLKVVDSVKKEILKWT